MSRSRSSRLIRAGSTACTRTPRATRSATRSGTAAGSGSAGNATVNASPLRVIGSTMGTRNELAALVNLLDATGVRPLIDSTMPMDQARDGFKAMAHGDVFGKIVFTRG